MKRPRPLCPASVLALPTAVWEDHLLPLLTCRDAARLGCTCEALRGVVREHYKWDLGKVTRGDLRAALTTFPRARTVELKAEYGEECGDEGEVARLVQWLREGGAGRHITDMVVDVWDGSRHVAGPADVRDGCNNSLVHRALRAGALPSLRGVLVRLSEAVERALLSDGFVGGADELHLTLQCDEQPDHPEMAPQLAALGLVRHLASLTKLEIDIHGDGYYTLPWPPFIPPSLQELHIAMYSNCRDGNDSLTRAVAGMLGASGARLDRLEVLLPLDFYAVGDGLLHLAQALRCCSPSLKSCLVDMSQFRSDDLLKTTQDTLDVPEQDPDYGDEIERLRVHCADVLAGLSTCSLLQTLVLLAMPFEPLFPPGTAFPRLTHLKIRDYERKHPPDAGAMGVWELMASGGLPALAQLSVTLRGGWGGVKEMRSRVAPALEAVAGTLTHLRLVIEVVGEWRRNEVEVGYELGAAMGNLRRLKDLHLSAFNDGQACHAFGQGLAASGGGRPLPLLRRLKLCEVTTHPDQVASLILVLPSVRILVSSYRDGLCGLLTACALRQTGFQHTWAVAYWPNPRDHRVERLHEIVRAIVPCQIPGQESWRQYHSPTWGND
jgi:hypothetical protein